MEKLDQGKYEILTTKADAIEKFMQMQGVCREKISDENLIEFYCSKKGEIIITNPPKRHIENTISTELFAEITEQDGKTYVSYYTTFSKLKNVTKLILLGLDIIIAVFAIIFAILSAHKKFLLVFGLVFFVFQLFASAKEKKNSPKDSDVLIKELEKRIEAVNLWDK